MENMFWKFAKDGHNAQPVKLSYASNVYLKDTEGSGEKREKGLRKCKSTRRVQVSDERDESDRNDEVHPIAIT